MRGLQRAAPQHRSAERWRGGGVGSGTTQRVDGDAREDRSELRCLLDGEPPATVQLPADVGTTNAFWTTSSLQRAALVDSVDGEPVTARFSALGEEVPDGRPARRFALAAGATEAAGWFIEGVLWRALFRHDGDEAHYRRAARASGRDARVAPGAGTMLSYRHAFHAGNFADVLKHVVLVALLDALARKPAPFCVLDTHAGAGRYDLRGERALLNREHEAGLLRVWWRDDLPPPVARWLALVRAANPRLAADAPPRWYPGSPMLVASALREADRLLLCELHPAEQDALRRLYARRARVGVHARDGYEALAALLPPAERRGLVLVDPSYETRDEIGRMTAALDGALQRWSGGVYAVWYPLLARKSMASLFDWAHRAGQRVLRMELRLRADLPAPGMHGCGMLILNTPWRLDEELAAVLPWLAMVLGENDTASGVLDWLVPDAA